MRSTLVKTDENDGRTRRIYVLSADYSVVYRYKSGRINDINYIAVSKPSAIYKDIGKRRGILL